MKRYGKCVNNPSLCNLFNELYNGIDGKIDVMLANQLKMLDDVDKTYAQLENSLHIKATIKAIKKGRR